MRASPTTYLVKKPGWIRRLYGDCLWEMPSTEKIIYLTFDDGPHPEATPFVLDELKRFNAKGTFFCVGENVVKEKEIYNRIISEGHAVGNHSFSHLDGWKASPARFMEDIRKAKQLIHSDLYRPPYGHIFPWQVKKLKNQDNLKVIMWSVLSGDFDVHTTPERCYENVRRNIKSGAIVVFHDSTLAFANLQVVLPKILEEFSKQDYSFRALGKT